MTQLEYYKCVNNKYLATIDLSDIKSSENKQPPVFICLLDKSGSMGGNVYIFVKSIFPLILEKLGCGKEQSILITYDSNAYKYIGNSDYFKNQNLSSGGGNELSVGLAEVEKIFDDYIKSNKIMAIRLLTISDGDSESNLFKKIDELILKIKNKLIINSHVVRYFTSDSPPDTKGLCSMLKLNNITIGKSIDIKSDYEDGKSNYNSEDNNEKKAKRIVELFLNDGLDEHYKIISEQKNIYESPWSEPNSEL